MVGRFLGLGVALIAYLAFLASFLVMVDFLANGGVVCAIDRAPADAWPRAVAIDVALIALFGASHSVMARPAFKSRWTRVVPKTLERSVYVLTASVFLALIGICWRALPAPLFTLESGAARTCMWALSGAGLVLTVASTFLTDHFDLFGLRQTWLHARGLPYTPVPFQERSLYRFVRHPMMLGLLLWMWATPSMTAGHLLFAASMTLYIAIGVRMEERDLLRTIGEPYARYRQRVRAVLPVRRS